MTEQQETLVCPLRKVGDRRFRARHYAVWMRKCARCRGKIVVSYSLKTKADALRELRPYRELKVGRTAILIVMGMFRQLSKVGVVYTKEAGSRLSMPLRIFLGRPLALCFPAYACWSEAERKGNLNFW